MTRYYNGVKIQLYQKRSFKQTKHVLTKTPMTLSYKTVGIQLFTFVCVKRSKSEVHANSEKQHKENFKHFDLQNKCLMLIFYAGIGSGSTYSILAIKQTVCVANVLFFVVNFVL